MYRKQNNEVSSLCLDFPLLVSFYHHLSNFIIISRRFPLICSRGDDCTIVSLYYTALDESLTRSVHHRHFSNTSE